MTATAWTDAARAEAERQLAAASARHREAVASTQEFGRPETGQYVSVKSLGRAVHVVSFTLRRAADAGVPFDRLVELTGWEPELVREGLERLPEARVIARLAPAGVDPRAVAQAAAAFEAITRLHELTQRVLADVDLDHTVEAPSALTPAELDDLHDRLETAWSAWRQALGRRPGRGSATDDGP
jgi:hypothetical protein